MLLVYQEEIVEIATHFLGRAASGHRHPTRHGPEKEETYLAAYFFGSWRLWTIRFDTLLGSSGSGQVLDVSFQVLSHSHESCGQLPDLVLSASIGRSMSRFPSATFPVAWANLLSGLVIERATRKITTTRSAIPTMAKSAMVRCSEAISANNSFLGSTTPNDHPVLGSL